MREVESTLSPLIGPRIMFRRNSLHHARCPRGALLLAASLALWLSVTTLGCGDDLGSDESGSGGSGGGTGSASTGASATGGTGTGGGLTGGSGTGGLGGSGGAPPLVGPPGTETVSGGAVVRSPNYRMIVTVGQPTVNQSTTTSPSYRLQGGLVGANESLP